MRLFIAVNFDCETQNELVRAQERLRRASASGSFSRPENLHLTLAFLAEQPPAMAAAARCVMDSVFVPELELVFDRAGCFHRDEGELWWAGIAPNAGLLSLQAELAAGLIAAGFELEERKYLPHVTLARRAASQKAINPAGIVTAPIVATADAISLMLSEQRDGRLHYRELYRKSSS